MINQQLGRYKIIELLGEGSFAWVYRAVDEELDRLVALKVLKPAWLSDSSALARFKQEAKTMANLHHPNIAIIYDVGEAEGHVFLAQFLVDGETLAAHLKRTPFTWSEMLVVLHQVGAALTYAHGQGVIHRDIKPANILLHQNGQTYLGDFGLVRAAEGSVALSTSAGGMIGTPSYMAPEQWEEESVTPKTDIYALCCVIVEMLTGKVLFGGSSTAGVMRKHLMTGPELPISWPPDVPKGLTEVLQKGLAQNPNDRISSAQELIEALTGLEKPSIAPVLEPEKAVTVEKSVASPIDDKLEAEASPTQVTTEPLPIDEKPQPSSVATPATSNNNRLWLWIGGGVIVIVMGLFYFLSLGSETPRVNDNSTTPQQAVVADSQITKTPTKTPRSATSTPRPTNTPRPATSTRSPTNTSPPPTSTRKSTNTATPTTEATPRPTNTPIPLTPTVVGLLFQDDFGSNAAGWDEGYSNESYDVVNQIIEGKLRRSVTFKKGNSHQWTYVPNFSAKDFQLTVETTVIESSNLEDRATTVGMIFRSKDNTYYLVDFANAGFQIWLRVNGEWRAIKTWTATDAFKLDLGITNTFGVSVRDSRLSFFANNQELITVEDSAWNEPGGVGLSMFGLYPGQKVTVDFDNLMIESPH